VMAFECETAIYAYGKRGAGLTFIRPLAVLSPIRSGMRPHPHAARVGLR
jgi:hypothetical protein